jgi:hypothetical protein
MPAHSRAKSLVESGERNMTLTSRRPTCSMLNTPQAMFACFGVAQSLPSVWKGDLARSRMWPGEPTCARALCGCGCVQSQRDTWVEAEHPSQMHVAAMAMGGRVGREVSPHCCGGGVDGGCVLLCEYMTGMPVLWNKVMYRTLQEHPLSFSPYQMLHTK